MKHTAFRCTLTLTALALIVLALPGCPQVSTTFSIKLNNTGPTDVVEAYFQPASAKQGWGENLLTKPLQTNEYVIIEGLPRQEYGFRVVFDYIDPETELRISKMLDENWAPSQGEEFATWHAGLTDEANWGLGYSWGYTAFEGEILQPE